MSANTVLPSKLFPTGLKLLNNPSTEGTGESIHLVATRYFLSSYGSKNVPDLDQWFLNRGKLFESFACKSMLNQRLKPTVWLLFVDKGMANRIPSFVRTSALVNFTRIIEVDPAQSNAWLSEINDAISILKQTFPNKVISCTRLDNDDALASDFFYVVDKMIPHIADCSAQLLSFPYGIQKDIRTNQNFSYIFPHNHFLVSLHQPGKEDSVLHSSYLNHSELFSSGRKAEVVFTKNPMWLEVLHGENLKNQQRSWYEIDNPKCGLCSLKLL